MDLPHFFFFKDGIKAFLVDCQINGVVAAEWETSRTFAGERKKVDVTWEGDGSKGNSVPNGEERETGRDERKGASLNGYANRIEWVAATPRSP